MKNFEEYKDSLYLENELEDNLALLKEQGFNTENIQKDDLMKSMVEGHRQGFEAYLQDKNLNHVMADRLALLEEQGFDTSKIKPEQFLAEIVEGYRKGFEEFHSREA